MLQYPLSKLKLGYRVSWLGRNSVGESSMIEDARGYLIEKVIDRYRLIAFRFSTNGRLVGHYVTACRGTT